MICKRRLLSRESSGAIITTTAITITGIITTTAGIITTTMGGFITIIITITGLASTLIHSSENDDL